jgi:hypothetical protein
VATNIHLDRTINKILGLVAYHPSFPSSLDHMHDVFHVCFFHHCILDPSHDIDLNNLQVLDEEALKDESIGILNR